MPSSSAARVSSAASLRITARPAWSSDSSLKATPSRSHGRLEFKKVSEGVCLSDELKFREVSEGLCPSELKFREVSEGLCPSELKFREVSEGLCPSELKFSR
jgi:hypothetical protein